ncbi:AMP-binding protein [Aurantivibrio plasticivorans]
MNNYTPLQSLLSVNRPADYPLVEHDQMMLTWGDWKKRVAQWRKSLRGVSGSRVALYCDDSFEFSAMLYAIWAEGKVACVPGSNLPEVTKQLSQRVDAFIGEFNDVDCLQCTPDGVDSAIPDSGNVTLDESKMVLEVFTSGSSGEPSAISKELSQLNSEVHNLYRVWGDALQGAVVLGTVSHHHIYGMLFRVFLPLAAGLRFYPEICEFFEDVQRIAVQYKIIALISSPTHLTRIPDADWQEIRDRCVAIYSSGAPLPAEGSADSREKFGLSPYEVFGSSETGGIAWRQQSVASDVFWQPFPGIDVSIDASSQCLSIQSPYLPAALRNSWYVTPDMAVLDEHNHFQLKGRADSIVKVEGKRVSLTDVELRLKKHEWVQASKLLLLDGRRTQLGAVVELSSAGQQMLAQKGKRHINQTLQNFLAEQFDRPVLPRRWRYCERMPYTSQGKLVRATLLALFEEK